MLSVREKLSLQRSVKEGLTTLKAGVQDVRERLQLQRSVKEMLNKLKGEKAPVSRTLYDRLVAGEFINYKPLAFCDILRDVLKEIDNNLQMIAEPIIVYLEAYLEAHPEEVGVFEAVSTIVSESIHDTIRLKFLLNEIRNLHGDQFILDTLRR
ncbi:MAG: hypothetical protein IJU76_14175 [Desulfovibrionaceae bacterium]|nr:hypothetical protein [Desulfovibrionaceae bacterium]